MFSYGNTGKRKLPSHPVNTVGFIALKPWTCQFVTHVENLLKIETPLNVIFVWQKYI